MEICPFMSYAANQVPCVREQCAIWDKRNECCGVLGSSMRIQDALQDVVATMNDIKVKF